MSKAIRIHNSGGPEVLSWESVTVGDPGPGEVRLRNTAIGLNFIDVYHRIGLYSIGLPSGLGIEGAGVVEAVGAGVTEVAAGDRVAYAGMPLGAYAEERLFPADRLVRLPEAIDDRTAAAIMLKGMTARYLLRVCAPVRDGDIILVHAAAGGVGLIACQWARHLGATVIGTVGSDAKARLARDHGCDHVVLYAQEDFVARVREITNGRGVDIVYDSVGRNTFEGSLDCLRRRGTMVSFGNASGAVAPFEPSLLARKGSLFFTRPMLFDYIATRDELLETATDLFDAVAAGQVTVSVNQTYPLAEAADAHRDLEARRTAGSTVLVP